MDAEQSSEHAHTPYQRKLASFPLAIYRAGDCVLSSPQPLRTKVSDYATVVDLRLLLCADMASKRSMTAISIS
jgi:hypothetical protein